MPDDAAALDDLLGSPSTMGDDSSDDLDSGDDEGEEDEFTMHAETALDPDADPKDRTDALRMAIMALTRGG